MDYQFKKFSVPLSSQQYADGWERVFGKKKPTPVCEFCGTSENSPLPSAGPYSEETLCGPCDEMRERDR